MTDVDAVYDVIQHIDQLRHYGRNRQLKKQLPDGGCAQHFLVVAHWSPPSFPDLRIFFMF